MNGPQIIRTQMTMIRSGFLIPTIEVDNGTR